MAAIILLSTAYNLATFKVLNKASTALHASLLEATMHAPLSFFDTTPLGRVVNRFTSDLEVIDRSIPLNLGDLIYCSANILSVFTLVCTIVPHLILGLLPVLVCLFGLQVVFTRCKCQLKRLEATAKAPILSNYRCPLRRLELPDRLHQGSHHRNHHRQGLRRAGQV